MRDYEPYGPEWAKEVKRLSKAQLICMLAATGRERDYFKLKHEALAAIIDEGKERIEK